MLGLGCEVVALASLVGMPNREFSKWILAASWPQTSPEEWQNASQAQHAKGAQLIRNHEGLRDAIQRLCTDQSGATIDGLHDELTRKMTTISAQAASYFALSHGSEEIGELVEDLRRDLDNIDRDAHSEIQRLRSSSHGLGNLMPAIFAVVADAAKSAKAADAKTAGLVSKQMTAMGLGDNDPGQGASGAPGDPGLTLDDSQLDGNSFGGGRRGLGGMPQGKGDPAVKPRTGDAGERGASSDPEESAGGTRNQDPQKEDGETTQTGNGLDGPHHGRNGDDRGLGGGGMPPMSMPFGGGGSSLGGGGGSPLSSAGGGLSGLKMPDTSSLSGVGGMGQGLGLGSGGGLPGGSGLGTSGMGSPMSSLSPSAASTDFSRGMGAALGGAPAAPLVPPASSAPPATSGVPAGAAPAGGPASVSAAAGSPVSAPASTPMAAPVSAGPSGAGMGSMGPLPPYGSDVRSAAPVSAGGAPVSAASGSGSPTVSSDRGGSSGGGMSVPPGVVSTGMGAGAGAGVEGVRAVMPDPLLEEASRLLRELLEDSRLSPFSDWCVGVFRSPRGVATFVTNSDGAGCIPLDVFLPRSVKLLFADPALPPEFRSRWFSWANPAETMLAFGQWASKHAELVALAVSIDQGGSAVPARLAGVASVDECSRASLPDPPAGPRLLDAGRAHRLEMVDPALYARLTGVGEGRRPDQSEAWITTTTAAQTALGRAGGLPDLAVPPVIREVLDLVGRGVKVPAETWEALNLAYTLAVTTAAGLRPGWVGVDDKASPHVLANHDLARLMELLMLWKSAIADRHAIPYADIAYLAREIFYTPQFSGV